MQHVGEKTATATATATATPQGHLKEATHQHKNRLFSII